MTGQEAFRKITHISDRFIEEVAADMAMSPAPVRRKGSDRPLSPLARFLNSAPGVALICGVVALGTLTAIVIAGRNADPVLPPAVTVETGQETDMHTEPPTETSTETLTELETSASPEETQAPAETLPEPDPDTIDYLFYHDYLRYEKLDDGSVCISGGYNTDQTITELTIPATLSTGEQVSTVGALGSLKALEHVTLEEGIEVIEDGFLWNNDNVRSLSMPSTLRQVNDMFLSSFSPLYNDPDNWQDGVCYIDRLLWSTEKNLEGVVTVREGTTIIGEYAFEDQTKITEVILPDSVKTIGYWAFMSCNALEKINLPDGLTYIGEEAFYATKLTEVVLPEGLEGLYYHTFAGCSRLEKVYLSSSITFLESEAFYRSPVKELHIPSLRQWCDLEVIYETSDLSSHLLDSGPRLYVNGEPMTDLVIPEGVTAIRNECFEMCPDIKSITVPEGVTSIGEFAFSECENLESISLPSTLKTVGMSAFQNCKKLVTITIPASVTSLDDDFYSAFEGCTELETVYFLGTRALWNSRKLGHAFSGMSVTVYCADDPPPEPENEPEITPELTYRLSKDGTYYTVIGVGSQPTSDVIIPATFNDIPVTQIGDKAFENDQTVTSVTVGEHVAVIGKAAFRNSRLEQITLPTGLSEIQIYAFADCRALISVTFEGLDNWWLYETRGAAAPFEKYTAEDLATPAHNAYLLTTASGSSAYWKRR